MDARHATMGALTLDGAMAGSLRAVRQGVYGNLWLSGLHQTDAKSSLSAESARNFHTRWTIAAERRGGGHTCCCLTWLPTLEEVRK
eukprot:67000-Pelagomonas_calceolata.AAC.2